MPRSPGAWWLMTQPGPIPLTTAVRLQLPGSAGRGRVPRKCRLLAGKVGRKKALLRGPPVPRSLHGRGYPRFSSLPCNL